MRMRALPAAMVAVTALTLSACADAPGASAGRANRVDASFAQSMRVRDLQAVSLAQLARDRSTNDAVQQLAGMIIAERQPAADATAGWLATWDQGPLPLSPGSSGPSTPVLVSPGLFLPSEITRLSAQQGTEFDIAFLTMMISHHEAAIDLAAIEEVQGRYVHAIEMAQTIRETQTAQVDMMKALLRSALSRRE